MPICPSDSPKSRPLTLSTMPMKSPPISAGNRTHAAEHHDREGHEHEGVADARIDVERGHQQSRRHREAGAAEAEGDRVDMRDIDAHQCRAEPLLRDRADGLAGIGAHHEEPEQDRHGHRARQADQLRLGEQQRADFHHVEAIGHVNRARIRAENGKKPILDQDREAERHQQDVLVIAMARRADHEALQAIAEREESGVRIRIDR